MPASKKVSIPKRPTSARADQWVESRGDKGEEAQEKGKTKRLTLDIPADLHRKIKTHAASNDTTIIDIVQELLEKAFP